jgi:hypothetical protein
MKRASEQRLSAKAMGLQSDSTFVSTYLNLPPDAGKFYLKSEDKLRKIDIIPYIAGRGNPHADPGQVYVKRDFWIHRNVGPNKGRYICLNLTLGKQCPVCEHRAKLKAKDEDDPIAKELAPSHRQLYNVIDVEDRKAGIQIWDIAHFYFAEPLKEALNISEKYDYFAELKDGYSLLLAVKPGSSGGKNDLKVSRVDFKKRKKQYKSTFAAKAYCLDDLFKVVPYKELKALLLQTPDEDEGDDDDSGSTKKKKGKNMKRKEVTAKSLGIKKGSEVEHEELGDCVVLAVSKDGFTLTLEDEDGDKHKGIGVNELEVEGEKDEEEPKKGKGEKKGGKASNKKKDDDEDEDEDEDDDDDEEPVKKGKGKGKKAAPKKAPAKKGKAKGKKK